MSTTALPDTSNDVLRSVADMMDYVSGENADRFAAEIERINKNYLDLTAENERLRQELEVAKANQVGEYEPNWGGHSLGDCGID